jgi:hypothetical protein
MSPSVRYPLRRVQGRVYANFDGPGVIDDRSVVHVTAGEVFFGSRRVFWPGPGEDDLPVELQDYS